MATTIDPQAINLPMKIGIPCKNRIEIAAERNAIDGRGHATEMAGESQNAGAVIVNHARKA